MHLQIGWIYPLNTYANLRNNAPLLFCQYLKSSRATSEPVCPNFADRIRDGSGVAVAAFCLLIRHNTRVFSPIWNPLSKTIPRFSIRLRLRPCGLYSRETVIESTYYLLWKLLRKKVLGFKGCVFGEKICANMRQ